jgi:hypothetical protein
MASSNPTFCSVLKRRGWHCDKIIGQNTDRVQNNPLFPERASQNGMDLIDHEHAHFELSRGDPSAWS